MTSCSSSRGGTACDSSFTRLVNMPLRCFHLHLGREHIQHNSGIPCFNQGWNGEFFIFSEQSSIFWTRWIPFGVMGLLKPSQDLLGKGLGASWKIQEDLAADIKMVPRYQLEVCIPQPILVKKILFFLPKTNLTEDPHKIRLCGSY